jgi:hypothetical protein
MKTGTEMVVGEKADLMEKMKGLKTVVAEKVDSSWKKKISKMGVAQKLMGDAMKENNGMEDFALSDGISQNQGENMGTVKMPDNVFSK